MIPKERIQKFKDLTFSKENIMILKENTSDKEIEETIWEEISIPLSQVDIDNQSDGYIQYLNAVHWAKWGRDNFSGVRFAESELKPKIGADTIQNLFKYFQQEHGIMLMPSDLHEIENYMQPEVATVAQEFSEWIEINKWQRSLRRDIFYWYQEGNVMFDKPSKYATTPELFAKFEAERSEK